MQCLEIAIGVVFGLTAIMGIVVSVYPAETPTCKMLYIASATSLFIVGVVLIAWNSRAIHQAHEVEIKSLHDRITAAESSMIREIRRIGHYERVDAPLVRQSSSRGAATTTSTVLVPLLRVNIPPQDAARYLVICHFHKPHRTDIWLGLEINGARVGDESLAPGESGIVTWYINAHKVEREWNMRPVETIAHAPSFPINKIGVFGRTSAGTLEVSLLSIYAI